MKHQLQQIREAWETLLTNLDHAISSGAWKVAKGSQTDDAFQEATQALTALSELERMVGEREQSLAFYKRRCDALQQWQSKMRDPERTIVCDILANGCTLEPAGDRYAAPPAQQPQAEAVPDAMKVVLEAMRSDPDYAWSWHCNVAMAFYDAGGDIYTANQGAARFMRMLADVEPAHELPAAPQQVEAVPAKEDFCYCNDEISLQIVSGGGAPEGLYGRVTLRVNGEYVNYVRADSWQETPRARALEFVARHKSSDWPERCQQMVDMARAALAAPQQAEKPKAELQPQSDISEFLRSEREGWEEREPKQQAETVHCTRADLDRAYSAGLVEGERLAIQQAEAVPSDETLLTNLIRLLTGCYYMDPPDGGSVTILEQFERMAKDAARYRWLRDTPISYEAVPDEWRQEIWQRGSLDAAIDAAMAQGEKP